MCLCFCWSVAAFETSLSLSRARATSKAKQPNQINQKQNSTKKKLLSALAFLHARWVAHRDVKLSNLLYDGAGRLRLCDFGLARFFQPYDAPLTPRVVTLWCDRFVFVFLCLCVRLLCVRILPLQP